MDRRQKWDLIHFNFGLWDWYGWKQETDPPIPIPEFAGNREKAQVIRCQTGFAVTPLYRSRKA